MNFSYPALLLAALATASVARAENYIKFLEGEEAFAKLSKAEQEANAKPYLKGSFDYLQVLAPAPSLDDERDKIDVTMHEAIYGKTDEARWERAVADDLSVYPQFSEALGVTLDRAHLPRTIALLNRVEADLSPPLGAAKDEFHRARPFQRFKLERLCNEKPKEPEPNPTKATSYPSGHSSTSWAAVLVLAQVAPNSAATLLERGHEYGESRVVCGEHFPGDVEAGRLLATAIVERVQASPRFQLDLTCARAEYKAVVAGKSAKKLKGCK